MRAGILLVALSARIGGVTLPSDVYAAKGHCGTSSATCYHKERIARHFEQVIKRFKKTELPNRVRPEQRKSEPGDPGIQVEAYEQHWLERTVTIVCRIRKA